MKKLMLVLFATTACVVGLLACTSPTPTSEIEITQNEEEGKETVMVGDVDKKVILVVSFGTSYNDTREATIDAIENKVAEEFSDYEVRRAFTSQIIINKLAERDGLVIDNVTEAMERLVSDGVGTLVIQPTHVMHGFEYNDMVEETSVFAENFASFKYGSPLLSSTEDYEKVVNAIIEEYNVPEDTALVLMGHGTHHFANSTYSALDYMFKDMGYENVFVGTVEGYPEFDSVLKWVNNGEYNKVVLAPLMVVAGDHASNDMAGDEDDSWKVMFKSEGKEVETILKGLGEIVAIQQIYVEHIEEAIGREE